MVGIAFDEAFFGEKHRAHAVLSSSCEGELGNRLAHQLDLPSQIPPSVDFVDYVSGFPFEDRYIIARTSLDSGAVRQGMVFSHAVIFDLTNVSALNDIEPIFASLRRERPTPLEASRTSRQISSNPNIEQPAYLAVAQALVAQLKGPVVISNNFDFETIIASVWSNLFGELRKDFSFRLSFGPDDVSESGITLVTTPPSMLSRWRSDQIVIDPGADVKTLTPAISLLGGGDAPDFRKFVEDLEIDVTSFSILAKLDRAYVRLDHTESSFAELISGSRLIGALQPDPILGTSVKSVVADRIINAAATITIEDALLLRNFDAEFLGNADTFWECLAQWMQVAVESEIVDEKLAAVFANADRSDAAIKEWRQAIWVGFETACKSNAASASKCVWTIAGAEPAILSVLVKHCPSSQKFGEALADQAALVKLRADGKDVTSVLLSAGFVEAEAEIQCQDVGPTAALSLLGSRDDGKPNNRSLDRILSKLSDLEVIRSVETNEHPHLFKRAAERLVANPSMLEALDYALPVNQKLFASAIQMDKEMLVVGDRLSSILEVLIDRLLDGNDVDANLLRELSESPLANILDYPRRHEAWSVLSPPWKEGFLTATADAWVEAVRVGQTFPVTETELAWELASEPHKSLLLNHLSSQSLSRLVAVFLAVDTLPEHDFTDSFVRQALAVATFEADDMTAVGQLLIVRRWKRAVEQMVSRFEHRQDIRPLFQICSDYVPTLTRWFMGLHRPNRHEIWELLQETVIDLYRTGPSDLSLWERAGGHTADIMVSESGRQQWQAVIGNMKNGGVMSATHLVETMLADFPSNSALRYLATQRFD